MAETQLIEVDCPVCGSTESRHVFSVRDYVYRISDHAFGVRRCVRCGAGFLSPRPRAEDIGRFYPENFYWSYENSPDSPLHPSELLKRRAPQIAAKLARMTHLSPGRLLDIGTMKGEFLYAARQAGWQAEGVEFGRQPPNLFDVSIRYGEFLDMNFPLAGLDCITMWAVLEHVYEPRAYVRKVAELLSDEGRFIGVVTNFNSLQARLLRADDYPRHLTLFTKASLESLLRAAGLALVRVWTDQKLFGGQLRGAISYVTKLMLGYQTDEALYEMRDWRDPEAFCCKFRGRPSRAMKWVNRIDYLSLWLPEKILDLLGLGLNLGFEAKKISRP